MKALAWLMVAGIVGSVWANPIVIDEEERPIHMLSEKVEVVVGAEDSAVMGSYQFKQLADDYPKIPDTHVRIAIPAFVPAGKSGFSDAQKEIRPVAVVNGREYRPLEVSPLGGKSKSLIPKFPKETEMVFFLIPVPLEGLPGTFDVSISYRQPHVKSGFSRCAMYCPMIFPGTPNADGGDAYRVSFRPAEGQQIKLISKHRRVLKNASDEVMVSAFHLENIVVKASAASGQRH